MGTKSIKSILLLGLFLFIGSQSFGQVFKLKTTDLTTCQKMNNDEWGEWSDLEPVSELVVMDIDEGRITIHSKQKQVYDVVENEGAEEDEDGEYFTYLCVDEEGNTCRVMLIVLHDDDEGAQLNIEFSNVMALYNLRFIE